MITNWNLLKQASAVIPCAKIQYRKYAGNAQENDFGIIPPPYGDPVTVRAHVQPVPSAMYAQLDLQPGRNARRVFIPADVSGMEEIGVGGDVLLFGGKTWKITSVEDWHGYDGWKALVVVEEKDYPTL